MNNPFLYGEEVQGDKFIGRNREIKTFIQDIKANERIFLISPRRYGKTSLIVNLFDKLKAMKFLAARLDLYKASSLESFANLYANTVISALESIPEKWLRAIKEFIPALRPVMSLTSSGSPELSFNIQPHKRNLELLLDDLLNLPERIALKRKKRIVIAFDEFQEIRTLNGKSIEKKIRANIQSHHHVSYIFSGSKKRMLYEMVSTPASAFYKMGKIFNLGKIEQNVFSEFIISQFSKSKISISADVLDRIFSLTEEVPYNIQFLCHQLWDNCFRKSRITAADVEHALEDILSDQSSVYLTLWDSFAPHQRRVLKAISNAGGENIFSQPFLKRHDLGAAASVQTSIKLLLAHDFLDKEKRIYFFYDVFFKEWLKRRM